MTTRGMQVAEMEEIASLIDGVLVAIGTEQEAAVLATTKERVIKLTSRFPLPYKL
jgi:glycine hydroxymethyltransferase